MGQVHKPSGLCCTLITIIIDSLHSVSLVARPFLQNYAHAVVACARGREGSGTELYPNAGPGILISEGGPLISSGYSKQKVKVQ